MSQMGAARFKAQCLQVMEQVRRTRREIVITKRGVPVVKIAPVLPHERTRIFGFMADKTEVVGDLERPLYTEAEWREFERQRRQQWDAWDREWKTYGAISGKRTVGLPPGYARRKGHKKLVRTRKRR